MLTAANAFVSLSTAMQASFGANNGAVAFAPQKFAQPACTSEPTSKTLTIAVASASHTSAKTDTTGMRMFAIASALHPLMISALKPTTGTVKTADADALLLIAVMQQITQPTTLTFAHANVLKTRRSHAMLTNILTMLPADASVHQTKLAMTAITGTPESVAAWRNIALAQLATTGTTTPTIANAFHNPAQQPSNGTLLLALANAKTRNVVTLLMVLQLSSTHQAADADATTKMTHKLAITSTWTCANTELFPTAHPTTTGMNQPNQEKENASVP